MFIVGWSNRKKRPQRHDRRDTWPTVVSSFPTGASTHEACPSLPYKCCCWTRGHRLTMTVRLNRERKLAPGKTKNQRIIFDEPASWTAKPPETSNPKVHAPALALPFRPIAGIPLVARAPLACLSSFGQQERHTRKLDLRCCSFYFSTGQPTGAMTTTVVPSAFCGKYKACSLSEQALQRRKYKGA